MHRWKISPIVWSTLNCVDRNVKVSILVSHGNLKCDYQGYQAWSEASSMTVSVPSQLVTASMKSIYILLLCPLFLHLIMNCNKGAYAFTFWHFDSQTHKNCIILNVFQGRNIGFYFKKTNNPYLFQAYS